ncbi:MAG: FG-GAP repeat protein [Planctomycetota bacterium]
MLVLAALGLAASLQSSPHLVRSLDVTPGAELGYDVDIDGDFAIVGARRHEVAGVETGRVVLLERVGGEWVPTFESNGAPGDDVGFRVAVDGNVAAYSTRGAAGEVWVLERVAGFWTAAALLQDPLGTVPGASFGSSIAIDGDRMAIGNIWGNPAGPRSGAVHVFERVGGVWVHDETLAPRADPGNGQVPMFIDFGHSVALEGDTLAVAAPRRGDGFDVRMGEVEVFRRGPGGWQSIQAITPPVPGSFLYFGRGGLALSGGTLAASADEYDGGGFQSVGIVHVHEWTGSSFALTASIDNPNPSHSARFGRSLDLASDRMIVGRLASSLAQTDGMDLAVDLFERGAGASWSHVGALRDPCDGGNTGFGDALAFDGVHAIVGAIELRVGGPERGGAYIAAPSAWQPTASVFCPGASCPCPPHADWAGCGNSLQAGGELSANGSASIARDDLELVARWMPPGTVAVTLLSPMFGPPRPFGDGKICLIDGLQLLPRVVGPEYWVVEPVGMVQRAAALHGAAGMVVAGQTWGFQVAYDDVADRYPCIERRAFSGALEDRGRPLSTAGGFSVTNGVLVTFTP